MLTHIIRSKQCYQFCSIVNLNFGQKWKVGFGSSYVNTWDFSITFEEIRNLLYEIYNHLISIDQKQEHRYMSNCYSHIYVFAL